MRATEAPVRWARSARLRDATSRWSHARLSAELVGYEIKRGVAGSALGIGWAVLQPLLLVGSYWLLLGILHADRPGGGGAGAELVTLLAGLVPWLFFARGVAAGLRALTSHANLIKQVAFPTGVLPFVAIGGPAVDLAVGMVVLVAASAAVGLAAWTVLLVVPLSLLLAAALAALASLLAPLAVMLPDARRAAQLAIRAGLFVTPVLYLPSALPDDAGAVAAANPMAYFISLMRYAVTGSRDVFVLGLGADAAVACGFTFGLAAIAYASHRRAWRAVIDHL